MCVCLCVLSQGLILCYEEAMTRMVDGKAYNLGAHFLWIGAPPFPLCLVRVCVCVCCHGVCVSAWFPFPVCPLSVCQRVCVLVSPSPCTGDRTRQIDGAHVEYFRGLANPIGIKVGPTLAPEDLVALIRRLWPDPEASPGKIVLITRLGARNVADKLPSLIRAVQAAALPVLWTCDPMHGNTTTTASGLKTRRLGDVLEELKSTFTVHMECGSFMGGAHFELTGEDVTECTGGPQGLDETDLSRAYTTGCDPRLNYSQSMEVAFLMSELLQRERERLPVGATPGPPGTE